MSAGSVVESMVPVRGAGAGLSPSPALQSMIVRPIPFLAAKQLIERYHYLHSLPGGTKLAFGVFVGDRLYGAITFGAGPALAYSLVEEARPDDCLTLTRLWLSDEMPRNSESRVIAVCVRALRRHTGVKFLVTYADPSQGHIGTIYQATGWLYTGLSEAMPLYDIGDGVARHSRSLAHEFGTHSLRYLNGHNIGVSRISQAAKHRYVYFLDKTWRDRLRPAVLPYPKKSG